MISKLKNFSQTSFFGLFIVFMLGLFSSQSWPTKNTEEAPKNKTEKQTEKKSEHNPKKLNTSSVQTIKVLKSIGEKYRKLGDWKALFTQSTYSLGLGKGTFNEGEFLFQKPNKFLYSLHGQDEFSDFVSDGDQAWYMRFREGRGKKAEVQHIKDVTKIDLQRYLLVLKGVGSASKEELSALEESFKIAASYKDGVSNLKLEPKKATDLVEVNFVFHDEFLAPREVKLVYSMGNETVIKISKYESVTKVPKKLFVPKIPRGSKIEEI